METKKLPTVVSFWSGGAFTPGWVETEMVLMFIYLVPKQYTLPSSAPTITRPSATAGELSMAWPTSYDQSSFPLSKDIIYSRPSSDPTTTLSPQITGELSTLPRAAKLQSCEPSSRLTQCTSLSRPPNTTRSLMTA